MVLLGRQFGGVNSPRIFLFSQLICLFNPDATDELRNFVESSIEAVARNMFRLFENYYPFLYLCLHLLSEMT